MAAEVEGNIFLREKGIQRICRRTVLTSQAKATVGGGGGGAGQGAFIHYGFLCEEENGNQQNPVMSAFSMH